LEEGLVCFEGHPIVDVEVFVEVEPSPIQRSFACESVFQYPALPLSAVVDVALELGEDSIIDLDLALLVPPNFDELCVLLEIENFSCLRPTEEFKPQPGSFISVK